MTKKLLALFIVPIVILGNMTASGADNQESLLSTKTIIDTCLPVKPLPPLLSLEDVTALDDAKVDPTWCRLVSQLGYQSIKAPMAKALPHDVEKAMNAGSRAAEQATRECLDSTKIGIEDSLKNRLIAYVSQQYKCDRINDWTACISAKYIGLNILYGDIKEDAVKIMRKLNILMKKSKECTTIDELTQYCQQIGLKSAICEKL